MNAGNEVNDSNQSPSDPGRDNPYLRQAQTPDLDAAAPVLKAEDVQRLNRKALFFLGATVLLVLAMGVIVLRNTASEPKRRAEVAEQVRVPELPREIPVAVAAPPPLPSEAPESVEPIAFVPAPIAAREAAPPPLPVSQAPSAPRAPTLMDRRIQDAAWAGGESNQQAAAAGTASSSYAELLRQMNAGGSSSEAGQQTTTATQTPSARPTFLANADVKMTRGTYLRCIMETRIVTDMQGFTSCVVTESVYSVNGRRLLVPRGSKIFGQYNAREFINNRVAVMWDRILTPEGIDITLSAPGVDNLGSAGTPGDYDGHWAQRISSALLISLLSDTFKYAGEKYGPESTAVTGSGVAVSQPFQSNTARTVQRLADQAVSDNLRRSPTVTVNQGSMINIYVTQDVDFSSVLPSN